jgi:DNA-binding protein HU-beta
LILRREDTKFVTEETEEKIMADKAQLTVPLSKMLSELAEKHEMPKKKLAELFGDFIDLTVKNLKKGNKVRINGLGIMQVRNRPARMGRNPATGEAIKIKASRKVAFRVAKEVKEAI